jgi:hypothetical protein
MIRNELGRASFTKIVTQTRAGTWWITYLSFLRTSHAIQSPT